MKRLLLGLVISIPALAFAQPGNTPPINQGPAAQAPPEPDPILIPKAQPPPPPGDTPPPPANLPPPPPGSPPQPNFSTPPPPIGPQQLGYAPGYGPDYTGGPPPGLAQYRHGLTFEANLGLGVAWVSSDGDSSDSHGGGTLALGLGGWLSNRVALSARFVESGFSEDNGFGDTATVYGGFFGPSLQLWLDDHFFLGGGLGWSFLGASVNNTNSDTESGFGLDLRAGYNFSSRSPNTFNVSVELTPGFYSVDTGVGSNADFRFNVFSILVGYQHL